MATTGVSSNPLSGLFDRPTTEQFWHYVAKHRSSEKFYQNREALEKRIEEIRGKLGICSFDRQESDMKWTPLHVAVISQNKAAVGFFLSKGARVDIQDGFGQTALDHAKLIPDLYPIFQKALGLPEEKQSSEDASMMAFAGMLSPLVQMGRTIGAEIDPFSSKSPFPPFPLPEPVPRRVVEAFIQKTLPPRVRLPSSDFTYGATTNDFGIIIEKLLFCRRPSIHSELPLELDHIIDNMRAIALREGFGLALTESCYFPRDHFIRIDTGEVLLAGFSNFPEHVRQAVEKSVSHRAYSEESATFRTHLCCFAGYMGMPLRIKSKVAKECNQHFSRTSSTSLYVEGGNLFTLTNAKGQRKILIGRDHLVQIHAQLRLEKHFERYPPGDCQEDLSSERIQQVAEEMYAMGLLRLDFGKGKVTGFLSEQAIQQALTAFHFEEERKFRFREVAVKRGLLTPIQWNEELVQIVKPAVANYLAQRGKLPEYLSSILRASPDDFHFITQFAYHLDVFIKPGPKGSLFLQDFGCCIAVLEEISKNSIRLGLDLRECLMVARYLDTAKGLQESVGPSLSKTKKELEEAGFIVIPSPGLFYDQHYNPNGRTYHLNFLNAVSAWSDKRNHYFYIATGVQVGNRLGSLLSEFFAQFLKQYEPNLEVYFVGENPKKRGDFSQAMNLWNQVEHKGDLELGAMGGIHCLSFEQATKEHREYEKTT